MSEWYSGLVPVLAPLVVLIMEFLRIQLTFVLHTKFRKGKHTFGKLTLGTITECKALGASFGGFLESPPGWYLYLSYSNPHQPTSPIIQNKGKGRVLEVISSRGLGRFTMPWHSILGNIDTALFGCCRGRLSPYRTMTC